MKFILGLSESSETFSTRKEDLLLYTELSNGTFGRLEDG
jgi:hypothetical protein